MSGRLARVKKNIKEAVGMMLELEIKDPRIGFTTITDVDISADLRHCKVFFSTLGEAEDHQRALAGLQSASGFIRGELGKHLRMKYTPEIEFIFDNSVERGARIEEILNNIKKNS
ncbi:MAG TPA: 30S ribosome-binding factor RbfA [Actinobacteria bacterium]|nr:30S ribosome-binding factor RbfA [Actinomycetes bacterium]HEX21168.1 30S ribosome-binding factor RbfA [Actinomycetota bacterium]